MEGCLKAATTRLQGTLEIKISHRLGYFISPEQASRERRLGDFVTPHANHGHVLNVSKTDVQNGAEKSYSIDGSASHDHTVVITASNFDLLKTNQSIQVDSSMGGGHSHAVTVSCA